MKKLKNNKGITLIALVITIIVMLILVGVSISMAVNGGLFNYAGKAVGETKKELTEENKIGNGGVTVDGKAFTSIESYVKETEKVTFRMYIYKAASGEKIYLTDSKNNNSKEFSVVKRNNMERVYRK